MPYVPQAYAYCFILAFVASAGILLGSAYRRGESMREWLLLVAACAIVGITWSKVFSLPLEALRLAWEEDFWPRASGQAFVGLAAGCLLAAEAVRYGLGYSASVIDRVVVILPVALILGSIGCLLVGCCYGMATDGWWGVTHPVHDLKVHPVPLYEIAAGGLVLGVLVWSRRRVVPPGGRGYGALMLYAVLRLGTEAFRPAETLALGLNATQWVLLAALPVLAWRFIHFYRTQEKPPAAPTFLLGRAVMLIGVLGFGLGIGRAWFTELEFVLLGTSLLLAAVGLLTWSVPQLGGLQHGALRLAILLPFLVGMQAASEGESATESNEPYFVIGGGGGLGRYVYVNQSCDGDDSYETYRYRYGSGEIQLVRPHAVKRAASLRFGGYALSSTLTDVDGPRDDAAGDYTHYALYTLGQADLHWVGAGFGVHFVSGYDRHMGLDDTMRPAFMLRLGPRDAFFFDVRLFYPEVGTSMYGSFGVGAGMALWRVGERFNDFSMIRLGLTDLGVYVNPQIAFKNGLRLSPAIAFGSREAFYVQLAMQYRLDFWPDL